MLLTSGSALESDRATWGRGGGGGVWLQSPPTKVATHVHLIIKAIQHVKATIIFNIVPVNILYGERPA